MASSIAKQSLQAGNTRHELLSFLAFRSPFFFLSLSLSFPFVLRDLQPAFPYDQVVALECDLIWLLLSTYMNLTLTFHSGGPNKTTPESL